MVSRTDTNQASEELSHRQKIINCFNGDDFVPVRAIDNIQNLIRTEKLKLLDEVVHQSTVNLKSAKAVAGWAELRKEQLEAEL